ncbi:septum formation family protein [Yinghuangia soli]|uniref:Septum formation family protein n=1 Tax=Yinghuangia soli TaxID=2908204 RepID=A0AA41PXC5_9ACTN|nr:septum formation family protein [Yinghuangia soli]MCF2527620.1 septum formation family protein [Yinghuangia soli]
MRAFRSSRISVLRATAVAASGVIAMAAVAGCGGDDKEKDKKPAAGATATSTASGTASANPSGKPTGKSTSTKKPTSSPTATDSSINAIDLKVGDCVNFDGDDAMSTTSCSKPHDGETVGVYELPSEMSPDTPTYMKDIEEKCLEYIEPVLDRQQNSQELNGTWIYPTAESWIMGGNKTLQCIVIRKDNAPLPAGKLK